MRLNDETSYQYLIWYGNRWPMADFSELRPHPHGMPVWFSHPAKHRAYQGVALQIIEFILGEGIQVGDCLPAERDLARKLNIGRNALREAMIALELAGFVEVRVGAGTFVRPEIRRVMTLDDVSLADQGPGPFELCAARRQIEGGIAAIAAESRSDADLAEIEKVLQKMEAAVESPRDWFEFDAVFHVRIAEATKNSVLATVVDMLHRTMRLPMFETLGHHVGFPEAETTLSEHRVILHCLKAGDAKASQTAMNAHLDNVAARLSREISGSSA